MPTSHTIVRGEHLALVAFRAGFGDVQPVLDHPDNSTFAGRPHPTILDVGEALTIPDLTAKQISLATGQRHKLVIQRIKTKLEVVFKTFRGGDTAATTAALSIGDAPARSVSLDAGKMELPIKPADATAIARVQVPGDGEPELEWKLEIGALGRGESDAGALARLRNLGYYRAVSDDADDREQRSAIEEFQADQSLSVTGHLDDGTRTKIAEIYGC